MAINSKLSIVTMSGTCLVSGWMAWHAFRLVLSSGPYSDEIWDGEELFSIYWIIGWLIAALLGAVAVFCGLRIWKTLTR